MAGTPSHKAAASFCGRSQKASCKDATSDGYIATFYLGNKTTIYAFVFERGINGDLADAICYRTSIVDNANKAAGL